MTYWAKDLLQHEHCILGSFLGEKETGCKPIDLQTWEYESGPETRTRELFTSQQGNHRDKEASQPGHRWLVMVTELTPSLAWSRCFVQLTFSERVIVQHVVPWAHVVLTGLAWSVKTLLTLEYSYLQTNTSQCHPKSWLQARQMSWKNPEAKMNLLFMWNYPGERCLHPLDFDPNCSSCQQPSPPLPQPCKPAV